MSLTSNDIKDLVDALKQAFNNPINSTPSINYTALNSLMSNLDELNSRLVLVKEGFVDYQGATEKELKKLIENEEKKNRLAQEANILKDKENKSNEKYQKELTKFEKNEVKLKEEELKRNQRLIKKDGELNAKGRKQLENFKKNKKTDELKSAEKQYLSDKSELFDKRKEIEKFKFDSLDDRTKQQLRLSKFLGSEGAAKFQNGSAMRTYNAVTGKGGMGKANAVLAVANMVGETISTISNAMTDYELKDIEKQKESVAYQYDVLKKTFAANSKLATKQLEIQSKILTKHLSGVTSFLTKGVKESAFEIGHTALEVNAELLKYKFEDYFTKQNLEHELYVRSQENKMTMNSINREQSQGVTNAILGGIDTLTGGLFGGITGAVRSVTENRNKLLAAKDQIQAQKLTAEMEYQKQMRDFVQQTLNQFTDTLQNYARQGLELVSQMEDVGLRIDKSIKDGMKSLGYTNYEGYKNTIQKLTQSLVVSTSGGKTFHLDRTDEDIAKYQDEYVRNTGRSIEMSAEDTQKAFLMSELWDENTVNSLTSQMNYFNHSIGDSVDMFYEMYETANRAGISNKKYAETLNKNLKLAQKYTFKGGTEGLMKMALWAEKTRFNMDSLDSMISKVQEGGLEGTITQAAQLQVLGGHAAMGADPLAMQYEVWSDPEAFAERMYNMTREYASFNNKTGEVEIKGLNARMVAAIAKAQGRSPEDLRAELTQRMKGEKIDTQLGNLYSEDKNKRDLLYNKAFYNKDTGRWEVNVNGESKDINQLKTDDWKSLEPIETQINDRVGLIYDFLKEQSGAQKYASTQLGFDTMDSTIQNTQQRIDNNLKWFADHSTQLKTMVEAGSKWITEEDQKYKDILTDNAANFQTALDTLSTDTDKLTKQINEASNNIKAFAEAAELEGEAMIKALEPILNKLGMSVDDLKSADEIEKYSYVNDAKNQQSRDWDKWVETRNAALTLKSKLDKGEALDYRKNTDEMRKIYDFLNDEVHLNMANATRDDFEKAIYSINKALEDNISDMSNINWELLEKYGVRRPPQFNLNDGIIPSNGSPMIISNASNVMPVNDAVMTHKDDTLFAKKPHGGIDEYFYNISSKISDLRNNILPKSMEYIMPMETTLGGIGGKYTTNNSKLQMETVKVEINGKLELTGSNGTSVNIIDELKNNPLLLRQLTQLMAENISKSINGGRATYDGIISTARFKGMGI